jgi:chemotaxis response regulator CheB
MSSADGWDLTVPEDAAELLAELRRHGVRPGQRLHVVRAPAESAQQPSDSNERPTSRKLDFIGSVHGGPDDLSTRTDDYLRRGFGHE